MITWLTDQLFRLQGFLPWRTRAIPHHRHAKLRKLGLREETIGYGPTKEKWEAWNQQR